MTRWTNSIVKILSRSKAKPGVSDCGCTTTSCCGESRAEPSVSDCGCSTTSCCNESGTDTGTTATQTRVTIDGRAINVMPGDNNIVDVASRNKIAIPAPCYRAERKNGCCSACVVEIDGEQKFACSTAPENGMNIIVDRADLKVLRKQRILEYREGIRSGSPCGCSESSSGNCCS